MATFKCSYEKTPAIFYFIPQALASTVLFLRISLSVANFSSLGLILAQRSLALKMGLAPLHNWFTAVRTLVHPKIFFLLSTSQKVIPLFVLINLELGYKWLFLFFSIFISTFSVFSFTQIIPIMSFSSIFTSCWLISAASFLTAILYLLIYRVSLLLLLKILEEENSYFRDNMRIKSITSLILLRLIIFRLIGIPPTINFIPKIIIAQEMIMHSRSMLAIRLIIASFFFFYIYLKLIITATAHISSSSTFAKPQNSITSYFRIILLSTILFI